MIFTANELEVLSNISGEEKLFGVINRPVLSEEKESFEKKTTESLQKKGILDSDGKLRKNGSIPIYILEQYKKAKKHLIINNFRLAVLPSNKIISVVPVEGGYDLSATNSIVLFTEFIKMKEYFRRAEIEVDRKTRKYKKIEDWEPEFKQCGDNNILIGVFEGKKITEEVVLYWNNEMGYMFNLHSGDRKEMSPRMMRLYLMGILDIEYDVQMGGVSNGN